MVSEVDCIGLKVRVAGDVRRHRVSVYRPRSESAGRSVRIGVEVDLWVGVGRVRVVVLSTVSVCGGIRSAMSPSTMGTPVHLSGWGQNSVDLLSPSSAGGRTRVKALVEGAAMQGVEARPLRRRRGACEVPEPFARPPHIQVCAPPTPEHQATERRKRRAQEDPPTRHVRYKTASTVTRDANIDTRRWCDGQTPNLHYETPTARTVTMIETRGHERTSANLR